LSIEILPVRGRRDLARFLALPWSIYDRAAHSQWAPPLRASVKDGLDARGNPFYLEAERELFLAYRDGRPVGRVAAVHNRRHNDFHGDRVGFFGFFESVDDVQVARALIDGATAWLTARGLDTIRGPMSPSTNHECGLLVEGLDAPSSFMTPWNPPYYEGLLESTGLVKAKDLLGFLIPIRDGLPLEGRSGRALERIRERAGLRFRSIDPARFADEAALAWDVYNEAWEKNWGFVPMSRAEFDHMAKMLRFLLPRGFACFAEAGDETVGFAMGLPDYNVTLKRNPGGRLFPFGLAMLLRDKGRLRTGRCMLLGVKAAYRNRGVHLLLADELMRQGHRAGIRTAEASWVLEDNVELTAFMEQLGVAPTRRWRLYERPLGGPSAGGA